MAADDDEDQALRSEQPDGALSEVAAFGPATPATWGDGPATTSSLSSSLWSSSSSSSSSLGATAAAAFRYRVGGRLGRGGMGVVDAGHDPALGRDVALKRAVDAAGEARLAREARLTARLDHPAIVQVLDLVRDDDGALVAVLQVRRGEGLLRAIATDRATWPDEQGPSPRLLRALLVVCEAVGHAHGRGIVHRDLSPNNLTIAVDGAVSVLDWGLAATVDEAARAPVLAGTPGFVAPEVRQGRPATPASDVWSLGTLLAHVVGPRGPAALTAIVARATAAAPGDRYPDAAALAADLRRFLDGEAVLAHREGPGARLARQVRRHPRRFLGAAAAAAIVVVVVASVVVVATGRVAAARRQADVARAAQLVDAAERALGQPSPDDALAARTFADGALAVLGPAPTADDAVTPALRARARGVVAATARVVPAPALPPSAPPVDDATMAALDLDGGRRVARRSPQGRRTTVRATTTMALWREGEAPVLHAPCGPGHSILDVLPRDDDGALVLCAPGELWWLGDGGERRRIPVGGPSLASSLASSPAVEAPPTRYLVGLAGVREDVVAIGTTRGRLLVVGVPDGLVHDDLELGGGTVLVSEGPRAGTVLVRRPERAGQHDLVVDVDTGAVVPVLPAGPAGLEAAAVRPGIAGLVGPHGRSVVVDDRRGRLWLGDGGGGTFAVDLQHGARAVDASGPARVIKSLAVQPRGDVVVIAAAGPRGFAFVDAHSGRALATPWQDDAEVRMRHVAFLDDDTVLAWNWNEGPFVVPVRREDDVVRVGDIDNARFDPTTDLDVRAVAAAPRGVWTVLGDGRVEHITRATGGGLARAVVATIPGGRTIAVATDHVVVATADSVFALPVDGGAARLLVQVTDGPIDAIAVTADGRVAVGLRSGRVRLHDAAGVVELDVAAHDERCAALTFCDEGRALCSGGWDGRVRVIEVPGPTGKTATLVDATSP